MKKVLLVLAILGAFTSINAQNPTGFNYPTKIYKIDTTIYSSNIPVAVSYVGVTSSYPERDTTHGVYIQIHTFTALELEMTSKIKNDSLFQKEIFWISDSDFNTKSNPELYDIYLKTFLEGKFGNNVTDVTP